MILPSSPLPAPKKKKTKKNKSQVNDFQYLLPLQLVAKKLDNKEFTIHKEFQYNFLEFLL